MSYICSSFTSTHLTEMFIVHMHQGHGFCKQLNLRVLTSSDWWTLP